MKIPGWCTGCHKVKLVKVTRPVPGNCQVGICDSCEDAADRRKESQKEKDDE